MISTTQAAKRLGIAPKTLSRYIAAKKVPAPKSVHVGTQRVVHAWTEDEIEELRKLLPKLINGRKTRWQKERARKKGPKKSSKKK